MATTEQLRPSEALAIQVRHLDGTRRSLIAQRNKALADDYRAGISIRRIARDTGLAYHTVEKVLVRAGVHVPTRRES